MPDRKARRDTWILHLLAILLPSLMVAASSLLQLQRDYSLVRSELRGLTQIGQIQDGLEAKLATGGMPKAGLDEIIRIGDESGLVLDPELDSYHLMQSLVETYSDELAALQSGGARNEKFIRGFAKAARYDEAQRGGHPAEAAAADAALRAYQSASTPSARLAALTSLRQAGGLWLRAMLERRGSQMLIHHSLIFVLALGLLAGGLILLRRQLNRDFRQRGMLEQALREAHAGEQAKNRFLASISHELRTPLNGISGQLQLLLMDEKMPERRASLRAASVCSDQLLELINDLIDQVKSEKRELAFHPVDFNTENFFGDIQLVFQPVAAAKDLKLELRLAADLPARLNSDPGRLRQLLFHLLDNAVKFSERGWIELTVECRDQQLRIEVTDDGPGLPAGSYESLFALFNSSPGHGLGIGLANCHRLVNLAGGELGAGNCVGRGARFSVKWPVRILAGAIQPQVALDFSSLNILAAEDNPVNRQVLSALLRKLGVQHLRLAENGREALRLAEQQAPDLILMDCLMPEMDGFEATRELRARGYGGPIVALTAHAENDECLACGMNSHMAKPLKLELLKELLKTTQEQLRHTT